MTWTSIHEELFKKINPEMDDYQGRVQSLPGHAVYNRAEEIAAMGFCYNQLMSGFHDHRAEELAPLLELEKPLETLSLRWMTEQQSRNFNEDFDQILHNHDFLTELETGPIMS